MKKNTFFIVCLLFLTSACSLFHVTSEEITSNYYPAKETISEVVYEEDIPSAYEIIGFVTVNAERNQDMQEVIANMKKEAAALGGDAITNITSNATGSWKKVPPQKLLGNAYIRANFTATVVAYQ